jgi:hypothetical protein
MIIVINPIKRALSCQGKSVRKYLGAQRPTKVPTDKRMQILLQQAALSLITSHNQHSPPPKPLSLPKSFVEKPCA